MQGVTGVAWPAAVTKCTEGARYGGHEAPDRRRSPRGDEGGAGHRDARPTRGRWATCRRVVQGRGWRTCRGTAGRRGVTARRTTSDVLWPRLTPGRAEVLPRTGPEMPVQAIPDIPTPLVEVRVQARRDPGVPDAVLVGQPPSPATGQLILGPGADELGVDEQWLVRYRVTAKAGSAQVVPLATGRLDHGWLVGTGQGSAAHWRAAGAALARAGLERANSGVVQVHLPLGTTARQAASLALGCVVGSHRYRVTSSAGGRRIAGSASGLPSMATVALIAPPGDGAGPVAEAVARAQVLGRATGLARDLANTPSGDKDPAWLAGTAARLANRVPGLRATVRNERWLAEHGFGGVLAVGGGSARPPRLLELVWDPPGASPAGEHLVLVGKGITFDTGGISIKPAENMHLMRTDMSGGAAVIATLLAVGQLTLPLRVTGLVPCAENHVSGAAYRPGDVVRQVNGTTTEVTN